MDLGKLMNGVNLADGIDKKDLEAAASNLKDMVTEDPNAAKEALGKVTDAIKGLGGKKD